MCGLALSLCVPQVFRCQRPEDGVRKPETGVKAIQGGFSELIMNLCKGNKHSYFLKKRETFYFLLCLLMFCLMSVCAPHAWSACSYINVTGSFGR